MRSNSTLITKGDFNAAILWCLSQLSVLNPEFILVYDDGSQRSLLLQEWHFKAFCLKYFERKSGYTDEFESCRAL